MLPYYCLFTYYELMDRRLDEYNHIATISFNRYYIQLILKCWTNTFILALYELNSIKRIKALKLVYPALMQGVTELDSTLICIHSPSCQDLLRCYAKFNTSFFEALLLVLLPHSCLVNPSNLRSVVILPVPLIVLKVTITLQSFTSMWCMLS